MLTIDRWFNRYGKFPLLVGASILVFLALFHSYKVLELHRDNQQEAIRRLSELTSLGISQRNRVLLETTLDSFRWQLDSPSVILSKKGETLIDSGGEPKEDWLHRVQTVKISGFEDYQLSIVVPSLPYQSGVWLLILLALAFVMICLSMIIRIQRRLRHDILSPLSTGLGGNEKLPIEELENLRIDLQKNTEAQIKTAVADAVMEKNNQIAHDIRSPLSAFQVGISSLGNNVSEKQRDILVQALERIKDMANELSEQSKNEKSQEHTRPVLLAALIDKLVTEKRTEYIDRSDVTIKGDLSKSYGLFARVDSHLLNRVLSNLVNNAAEAIEHRGEISISVGQFGAIHEISIADNGRGIPADILPKITRQGFTANKMKGSGLGLYHAEQTLSSWGGKLLTRSEVGKGTTITLQLPFCPSPEWFPREIRLQEKNVVFIIDDDLSVHRMWEHRFSNFSNVALECIRCDSELDQLIKERGAQPTLCLVDFNLIGEKLNGLELIKKYTLQNRSLLMTSYFESSDLLKLCRNEKVKCLPKPWSPWIPIEESVKSVRTLSYPHPTDRSSHDASNVSS